MRKLTIISHTKHYYDSNGEVVGLASTVMEINHLLELFDVIYHVAMLHDGNPTNNMLPYASNKVKFIAIPTVGGSTLGSKFAMLFKMPKTLKIIRHTLRKSNWFQFRAPTGIGFFVIPYLVLFYKGNGWFKYAGNWSAKGSPLNYKFQRFLLTCQNRLVTINGQWNDQPKHCLSFINPCLTDTELKTGHEVAQSKIFDQGQINLCFVGRLEADKGIGVFLKALSLLNLNDKRALKQVHIVGDGENISEYQKLSQSLDIDIVFHGLLAREAVHGIYAESHALVLPSQSEGFPKVIAEAMNYGCVPIVSEISAISQYVKEGQSGFLISNITAIDLNTVLSKFLGIKNEAFQDLKTYNRNQINTFTYSHYNAQIVDSILK